MGLFTDGNQQIREIRDAQYQISLPPKEKNSDTNNSLSLSRTHTHTCKRQCENTNLLIVHDGGLSVGRPLQLSKKFPAFWCHSSGFFDFLYKRLQVVVVCLPVAYWIITRKNISCSASRTLCITIESVYISKEMSKTFMFLNLWILCPFSHFFYLQHKRFLFLR